MQHLLHDVNIQATDELAPHLFERADVNKTGALIEMNAFPATLSHPRDERVIPQPAYLCDDRVLELAAELATNTSTFTPATLPSRSPAAR